MRETLVSALAAACITVGIDYRDAPTDGHWHNTDVSNDPRGRGDGRIKLFVDGEGGQVRNWKTGGDTLTFFIDGPSAGAGLAQADIEARQAKHQAIMLATEQKTAERHAHAETQMRTVKRQSRPAGEDHPYLMGKGVGPSGTLLEIASDNLVEVLGYHPQSSGAPLTGRILIALVKAEGNLTSFEMIDEAGRKSALRGGRKTDGYWATARLPSTDSPDCCIIIAEGVATALSLWQATAYPTVAALSCGNLRSVAAGIREAYPTAKIVVAADLGNGQTAAAAAATSAGCFLAIPAFDAAMNASFLLQHGKSPTDFNDLHLIAGENEVKRQIAEVLAKVANRANDPSDDAISSGGIAALATLALADWPEPQPIVGAHTLCDYPIDALPPLIQDAVREVQRFTQSPIAMVACSALSVVSLVVQGLVDVRRAEGLTGPSNLFFLVIAESGERKSSNDNHFLPPLRVYEREQATLSAPLVAEYRAELAYCEAKKAGVLESIKRAAKSGRDAPDEARQLAELERRMPEAPLVPRLLYSDATPEALTHGLATQWPAAGILSSEAGNVLGSHGMGRDSMTRYFAILNELWDGKPLRFDRRSTDSFAVKSARLTVALQVQETTLRVFLEQSKGLARGTGFLARFLVAWPASTQGTRLFIEAPTHWPALSRFHGRIAELLTMPLPFQNDVLTPHLLLLTSEARAVWVALHDHIEKALAAGGELSDLRDVASKAADNAARLAALFHVMTAGLDSPISAQTMKAAAQIVAWHLAEARRFFGKMDMPAELGNAMQLDLWLLNYCRMQQVAVVPVSTLQQYGPHRLRTKAILEATLNTLVASGRVRMHRDGRMVSVEVNPVLLHVPSANDSEIKSMDARGQYA